MILSNYFTKNSQYNKKIFSTISILLVFVLIGALSSCSTTQIYELSQTKTIAVTTPYPTNEILWKSTQTPTMSIIPTQTLIPTKTMDPILNLHITIDVTQRPIIISTVYPDVENYLYKNAVVTVYLGNGVDEINYLNLDDLNDNSMNNSDVEIEMATGNISNYSLSPINNTYYFYPGTNTVDYNSCSEHFPITGIKKVDYASQGMNFLDGKPYCVLTNDGRIAIVSFVRNSIKFNADYSQTLSINVTVYNRKINYKFYFNG